MQTILKDQATENIVKALTANLHAHVPLYSTLPGAMVCDVPNVVGLLTDLDFSENCVYRVDFSPGDAEQQVEQVLLQYRQRNCLPICWQVGPSTLPVDLGKYLLAGGFRFLVRASGMAADLAQLEKPVKTDIFTIEPVRRLDQLRQWVNIVGMVDEISDALREGFYEVFAALVPDESNENQLFLGLENGQPVAAARLLCTAGVAGIWHIATLPEARGKGYGTAMTLAAGRAGLERGYRFGILYATAAGYSLYRRLGFQEYCHIDVYTSPEEERS